MVVRLGMYKRFNVHMRVRIVIVGLWVFHIVSIAEGVSVTNCIITKSHRLKAEFCPPSTLLSK